MLLAIAAGPRAWSTVGELWSRTGLSIGEVERALAELAAVGWVAHWPLGGSWTLTPWGAERLGLEVRERGPEDDPYWAEPCERHACPRNHRDHRLTALLRELNRMLDLYGGDPEKMFAVDDGRQEVRLFGQTIRIKMRDAS